MQDLYRAVTDYSSGRKNDPSPDLKIEPVFRSIENAFLMVFSFVGVDAILAVIMVISVLSVSYFKDLPLVFPSPKGAAFVGMHYIYPLLAVAILAPGVACRVGVDGNVFFRSIVRAMICYVAILYAHFMFKLWIPHLNSSNYDALFWGMDQKAHWLVDAFVAIRIDVFGFISYSANFYMLGFVAMFYIGLIWQIRKAPAHARELMVACMLMQILGTIGYLLAPAVGPFRFEDGVNPIITQQQASMMDFYRQSVAHGAGWLQANGSASFTAGLAAMPSLHVAGASLFFLNARRHAPGLSALFGFILTYIVVTSVASRWHYLIDLPFGLVVAWLSLAGAERLVRLERRYQAPLRLVGRPALA